MIKKSKYLLACSVLAVIAAGNIAFADTTTTDFESANSVVSDGGAPGSGTPFSPGVGDTIDGIWTWYTNLAASSTSNQVVVPYQGGTQSIGEQFIRVGAGLELQPNAFTFFFEFPPKAIALLGRFTATGDGDANATWTLGSSNGIKTYYRNNGGAWNSLSSGVSFAVTAGSVDVLFVGNDGADSTASLDTITVTTPDGQVVTVPTLTEWGIITLILGLGGAAFVRIRRMNLVNAN